MADLKRYLGKLTLQFQGSEEEKQCSTILFSDIDISMGDKRLNNLAAMTYNSKSCDNIFKLLHSSLSTDCPWKTIYKSLLLLHTIVLYGSELAIDKCVDLCRFVYPLQQYNSALVKKGFFSGGTDYGAPVRAASKAVVDILMKDENIRKARADARREQNSLVPLGEDFGVLAPQKPQYTFGQGLDKSVGAGFGLEAVPGMYEGRPERYFDKNDDPRIVKSTVKDSQHTRDAQAPSLLDLVFDEPAADYSGSLPDAPYLPALERQKELEKQLAEQQAQLRKLQELQQLQQQLQQPQQPGPYGAPPQGGNLLDLQYSAPPTGAYLGPGGPMPQAVGYGSMGGNQFGMGGGQQMAGVGKIPPNMTGSVGSGQPMGLQQPQLQQYQMQPPIGGNPQLPQNQQHQSNQNPAQYSQNPSQYQQQYNQNPQQQDQSQFNQIPPQYQQQKYQNAPQQYQGTGMAYSNHQQQQQYPGMPSQPPPPIPAMPPQQPTGYPAPQQQQQFTQQQLYTQQQRTQQGYPSQPPPIPPRLP